jgi:hypothetical protein
MLEEQQRGGIIFQGQAETRFWVRALGPEEKVRVAIPSKLRSIPIMAEYEVSPRFKWIYIAAVHIDKLGIKDGVGVIYYVSLLHEQEISDFRADGFTCSMTIH